MKESFEVGVVLVGCEFLRDVLPYREDRSVRNGEVVVSKLPSAYRSAMHTVVGL